MVGRACEACRKAKGKCIPLKTHNGSPLIVHGKPVEIPADGLKAFTLCVHCFERGQTCSGASPKMAADMSPAATSETLVVDDDEQQGEDEEATPKASRVPLPNIEPGSPSARSVEPTQPQHPHPPLLLARLRFPSSVIRQREPHPLLPFPVMKFLAGRQHSSGGAHDRHSRNEVIDDIEPNENSENSSLYLRELWKDVSTSPPWGRDPFNFPESAERTTLH